MRPTLVLIGLRGAGKTSAGRAAAARLGWEFIDLDDLTPAELGCRTVREAFESRGEAAFRDAETRALRRVVSGELGPRVVALGGGTPTAPGAADLLRSERSHGRARVVYLRGSAAALRQRLEAADNAGRPPLTGAGVLDEIDSLLAIRDPLYRELADRSIEIDAMGFQQTVDALVAEVISERRIRPA